MVNINTFNKNLDAVSEEVPSKTIVNKGAPSLASNTFVATEADALDEIQTEKFAAVLKDYYIFRDGNSEVTVRGYKTFAEMNHADLLEYFYQDRSWANNNTGSMSKDLFNALTDDTSRKQQLAYIQNTYSNLPSFWDDPNRDFGNWLFDNGGAMIADPVNLISFGIGGQAAKVAYRQALKEALKGKVAQKITEETIITAGKEASKQALGKAVIKGAMTEAKIGAGIAFAQDAMLQVTAIKTGLQEDFSKSRLAVATGAGFGFGTVFGGAFSYGGFKLGERQIRNTAIKQLKDVHDYGRSEITGKRLFADLAIKKTDDQLYKNLSQTEISKIEFNSRLTGNSLDDKIVNLRKTIGTGRPPEEEINYFKYPKQIRIHLKNLADEMVRRGEIFDDVVSTRFAQEQAKILGLDPDRVIALGKSRAKDDKLLYAEILAHGDLLAKHSDDIIKLSNELHRVDITPEETTKILNELNARNEIAGEILVNQKEMTKNVARAQRFQQVQKDVTRASELTLNPENPELKVLKEGNPVEFYKAIAKLDDTDQVIMALQNARKVDKWDIASEFVNNNLLSSPDTHAINFLSAAVQTHWKPAVMLMRAAWLAPQDKVRASQLAWEALDTYTHMYVYTKDALVAARRSFMEGRGILDSRQMKFDNNIRQGQLQRYIQAIGKVLTEPLGTVGEGLQKFVVKPIAYTTSLPMRVLSATDEFFKVASYKARQASQINTQIRQETGAGFYDTLFNKNKYKERFKQLEGEYSKTKSGSAVQTADMAGNISDVNRLEVNDPLQYARETTFTQSAYSMNPETGKLEGGATGAVLAFTNKHKWTRALGLHFINTPSNLIKWNFEQLPFARKLIVSTRHALKKGADGKYINPEAAAEANARTTMGMLLWGGAFLAVKAGKITGGGSREYKKNLEKESTTGWQPYSYKTEDGRYVSLNRLDPIMMPFFIMADLMDAIGKFTSTNDDLPSETEKDMLELSMGVLTSLQRNLTSKFYTKNIIETANFLLSDDFVSTRAPDRIGASVLARGIYKLIPLSGALRYATRVEQDAQQELFTLSDRLLQLVPLKNKDGIMPKRNMFGEVVDRKNGWMFGLNGDSGIWSSPFAMTKTKNPAVQKFYENREFNYLPPAKTDTKSGIDLRTIRNEETGQTAYDRWRELSGQVKLWHKGTQMPVKQIIEDLITDPKSELYNIPDGTTAGKDWRQSIILKYVHAAERTAKFDMMKEFPDIEKTILNRGQFTQERFNNARKSALQQLIK